MSSLYSYLGIILMVFNNMIKNIGPDGDSAYFSAIVYILVNYYYVYSIIILLFFFLI